MRGSIGKPIPQGFFAYLGRYGVRGEVNPSGFRLELGGPQVSMVYAVGQFQGGGRPIFIRVLLTFKRWAVISFGVTILVYPALLLILNGIGFPFSLELLLFFLIFGLGGNFLFGLGQMTTCSTRSNAPRSRSRFHWADSEPTSADGLHVLAIRRALEDPRAKWPTSSAQWNGARY
jgi:hypothetical protein